MHHSTRRERRNDGDRERLISRLSPGERGVASRKSEELTAQPTSDANNPVDGRPARARPTRHDSAFGSAPTSGATLSPAQDLPVVVLIDGDRPLLINHIDGVGVGFEGMP